MAKPLPKSSPASSEVETPVVVMRRVGPERFEVVTGFVKGPLLNPKVRDSGVSMTVAVGTARTHLHKLSETLDAKLKGPW
jgi:hypothetical protein